MKFSGDSGGPMVILHSFIWEKKFKLVGDNERETRRLFHNQKIFSCQKKLILIDIMIVRNKAEDSKIDS